MSPQRDAALILQPVPAKAGNAHDEILRNLGAEQGRTDAKTINGLKATHFAGVRRNAQGQRGNAELTLVTSSKGAVYALVYAAKDGRALQTRRGGLTQAEESFRALTADDRRQARPWKIALRPYPAGGFAEMAKGSVLNEGQLKLLNGRYGGETPPKPGERVKTVVAAP